MFCCGNCFGHSFLLEHISKNSTETGICDFCYSSDMPLISPVELTDFFQSICSIYIEDSSDDADSLLNWFQRDWQIFCKIDMGKAQTLLSEILVDSEFVRKNRLPREYSAPVAEESWASFCNEIKCKNRFFIQHNIDLDRLKELLSYLKTDESVVDSTLFRARIQEAKSPIPLNEMGKPPIEKAKNGRANPLGISYLYTASTPETAIAETRPHPDDVLSVASFYVTEKLHLLNLLNPRGVVSPFLVDEDELLSLRHDLGFLCHLGNELSKPILPRVADLEYIPTQYLCEFVKKCGFDGVVFKSSISDGINVTLFDDIKVRAENVKQYKVTSLHYEQDLFSTS